MYYENPEGVSVHMGFPNPAADASLQGIDLNKILIQNTLSTFMMRIEGNDWQQIGIFDGSLVLIDRALGARPNDLVIWWQGSTFAISHRHRMAKTGEVWGVVTAVIQQYRSTS